ncbi:hypothetical protein C5O80_06685 [Burkholderia sp. SRS-46]|nr:hypothetical protein C5O80_06685 [Burkholderia sp. SRS-46]
MKNKADAYNVLDVNQRQEVRTIEILTILPGKVQVSNEQNKKTAQLAGTITASRVCKRSNRTLNVSAPCNSSRPKRTNAGSCGRAQAQANRERQVANDRQRAIEDQDRNYENRY